MKKSDSPFDKLAAPARRALAAAGINGLKDLSKVTEADLKQMHGVGPNAIKALKAVLRSNGLALAKKRP